VSFEPVDVKVVNHVAAPVPDVLVKIYNPAGTVFYTQATTDVNGVASLLLETLDYSMRFYRYHVAFIQPQLFSVLPAPDTNIFDVVAETLVLPISNDPRLCLCSGYFRELNGDPKSNMDIRFVAEFDALLLDGDGVIPNEVHVRTDKNGYAQISLVRCGMYQVTIGELGSDVPREVKVPDQLSANLPDVLFPVVGSVTFDPPGPYAISVGVSNQIEVTAVVRDSNGVVLPDMAPADVLWATLDPTIAVAIPQGTKLVIRGIAAGSTKVTVERTDRTIVRIPNTPIGGQPVDVTVT